jgi:hypothetical protein
MPSVYRGVRKSIQRDHRQLRRELKGKRITLLGVSGNFLAFSGETGYQWQSLKNGKFTC